MIYAQYKSEEELEDRFFHLMFMLRNYVLSISGDNRWFFNICYQTDPDANSFQFVYRSYDTPEYKNYLLVIDAVKTNNASYSFSVEHIVTDKV